MSGEVMHCPLCGRVLTKMYRVIERYCRGLGPGQTQTAYIPLWVCETHKFSVEINRLSRRVVKTKPRSAARKRTPGSAAD